MSFHTASHPIGGASGPAIRHQDVAAARPPKVFESISERRDLRLPLRIALGSPRQHADPTRSVGFLSARRYRPGSRAAEQRDELAALHSITKPAQCLISSR